MRYIVCSDIHGYYDVWMDALKKVKFDPKNDFLVVLGDLLDRGNKPLQCLKFVNSLPNKILIRGNHEDLIEDALKRGIFLPHDYHNGTASTITDLGCDGLTHLTSAFDVFKRCRKHTELQKYLNSVVDYAGVGDYIFVHGWIPTKSNWESGNWKDARWRNGMEEWAKGRALNGKTICCGHYHTSWGHHYLHDECSEFGKDAKFEPFVDKGIVALDGCTAYSGIVNIYIIDI